MFTSHCDQIFNDDSVSVAENKISLGNLFTLLLCLLFPNNFKKTLDENSRVIKLNGVKLCTKWKKARTTGEKTKLFVNLFREEQKKILETNHYEPHYRVVYLQLTRRNMIVIPLPLSLFSHADIENFLKIRKPTVQMRWILSIALTYDAQSAFAPFCIYIIAMMLIIKFMNTEDMKAGAELNGCGKWWMPVISSDAARFRRAPRMNGISCWLLTEWQNRNARRDEGVCGLWMKLKF